MLIEITYNVTDVFMSTTETPVYVEISFEQPGGTSAVWGSITGTLSNQTDLQNALNAKFDDPTGTTLQYIDGTGALQTFPLTLPVLQEVRNQTGATLDAGTVVYINGATGNKPTVTKAIATGDATSAQTLGMISAAIANNGVGYVVVIGTCGGLDTSAYTEGQQLYLSGTVAGGVTTTKPYAPIHLVYVGIVTRSHPNLGTIEVRVQNGIEVDEIHNVSAQTPSNNDGLFYNTSTSLWESKSITTALGYTPVPTTRNITINGVTYDLSADRTWTIAAGISGSGASGQLAYWTGASAVSGSNNLFWDAANGRLGIGTNAPTESMQVVGGNLLVDNNKGYRIKNTSGSTLDVLKADTSNNLLLGSLFLGGAFYLYTNTSFRWFQYPSSVVTERMQLSTSGNLLIGSTTDNGQRLQVYGDTLLRGSGNTSATTALTVQNSDSNNLIRILNNGSVIFGTASSQPLIATNIRTGGGPSVTGESLLFYNSGQGAGQDYLVSGTSLTSTSGDIRGINFIRGFLPTSGNATYAVMQFAPTINQTGGANGITRGLYVNPTLTAAADWRSIEWSNSTGFGLYGAGNALNYLAGRLSIGSTTNAVNTLQISRNVTGGVNGSGVLSDGTVLSDLTATYSNFYSLARTQATTFSLSELIHFRANQATFGAGSTVNNQFGFYADSALIGATNNYGFYGNIASGTGRWNLYMNGTANNYLAGSLGIGSTTLTGFNFRMGKNIEGALTSYGVAIVSTVQSGVTNGARVFYTEIGTQAASFTLSELSHYYSVQGSIGAGSSVLSQYGFRVHENLTGATNNYGFYGNIASGTGRWNLYMNGTADNYLAGNLGIGITPTVRLHVSGDTILKGSGNTSATTALTVQNSDSTNMFRFRNDGVFLLSAQLHSFRNTGTSFDIKSGNSSSGSDFIFGNVNGNRTYTSGTGEELYINLNFAPTSGTGVFAGLGIVGTINQTGGANGITRGIYVNPTLTSAADFRAIEVSAGVTVLAPSVTARASLRIPSGTAPTSPNDGDIWFDGTDIKMRIGGVTKTFTLI